MGQCRRSRLRSSLRNTTQKKAALGYLHEAWIEARTEGIDGDCLAQVCLFAALAEFVSTYGEDATAHYAEGLAERIRHGEFSRRRRAGSEFSHSSPLWGGWRAA